MCAGPIGTGVRGADSSQAQQAFRPEAPAHVCTGTVVIIAVSIPATGSLWSNSKCWGSQCAFSGKRCLAM